MVTAIPVLPFGDILSGARTGLLSMLRAVEGSMYIETMHDNPHRFRKLS